MNEINYKSICCKSCYYRCNYEAQFNIYNKPGIIKMCNCCDGENNYVPDYVEPVEYFKGWEVYDG